MNSCPQPLLQISNMMAKSFKQIFTVKDRLYTCYAKQQSIGERCVVEKKN